MRSIHRRLRLLLLVGGATAACAVAFAANAGAGYYGPFNYCYAPGNASVSGWNGWQVNSTYMRAVCNAGNPKMGLSYMYQNGVTYPYVWGACNCTSFAGTQLSDPRNISYGIAICKAKDDNNYGVLVDNCWTGNP